MAKTLFETQGGQKTEKWWNRQENKLCVKKVWQAVKNFLLSARVPSFARWILTRLPVKWVGDPNQVDLGRWIDSCYIVIGCRYFNIVAVNQSHIVCFSLLFWSGGRVIRGGWVGSLHSFSPSQIITKPHLKVFFLCIWSCTKETGHNEQIAKQCGFLKTRHLKYNVVDEGGWDLWMARAGYAGVLRN